MDTWQYELGERTAVCRGPVHACLWPQHPAAQPGWEQLLIGPCAESSATTPETQCAEMCSTPLVLLSVLCSCCFSVLLVPPKLILDFKWTGTHLASRQRSKIPNLPVKPCSRMDSPCSSIRVGQGRVEEWQKFWGQVLTPASLNNPVRITHPHCGSLPLAGAHSSPS